MNLTKMTSNFRFWIQPEYEFIFYFKSHVYSFSVLGNVDFLSGFFSASYLLKGSQRVRHHWPSTAQHTHSCSNIWPLEGAVLLQFSGIQPQNPLEGLRHTSHHIRNPQSSWSNRSGWHLWMYTTDEFPGRCWCCWSRDHTLESVLSTTAHKDQRPFSVFSEAQVKQGQIFEKRPY